MAIQSYRLGPGTLTLGTGPLAVSGQITNCRVEAAEVVTPGTAIAVLTGEELAASDKIEHNWTLAGTLLQDLLDAGVVDWSWTNKGTPQPFEFVPNTPLGRGVTGTTFPIPITIGGAVTGTPDKPGDPATSDFSWRCQNGVDEPVFGDA